MRNICFREYLCIFQLKKKIDMVHKQQEQRQEPRATFLHGKTTAATAAYLQFLFLLLSKLCSGSVYKDGKCPILT